VKRGPGPSLGFYPIHSPRAPEILASITITLHHGGSEMLVGSICHVTGYQHVAMSGHWSLDCGQTMVISGQGHRQREH
jgi:hypothetical protein